MALLIGQRRQHEAVLHGRAALKGQGGEQVSIGQDNYSRNF
jgi:hypothetical protein